MKDNRFRIIISNKNIYREIELSPDMQGIRVGTEIECDVRLRKELFFEEFELLFSKGNSWRVICSDNLYISVGDAKKLLAKDLQHGDVFTVKYQDSNSDVFNIEFLIDFDFKENNDRRKYRRI